MKEGGREGGRDGGLDEHSIHTRAAHSEYFPPSLPLSLPPFPTFRHENDDVFFSLHQSRGRGGKELRAGGGGSAWRRGREGRQV